MYGEDILTCAQCEASRFIDGRLICRILESQAVKVCHLFSYEPGTTDDAIYTTNTV